MCCCFEQGLAWALAPSLLALLALLLLLMLIVEDLLMLRLGS